MLTTPVLSFLGMDPDTNKSGDRLTRPLIQGSGKLGPAFPEDENPHDFVFS
jgi:hypothetical protein